MAGRPIGRPAFAYAACKKHDLSAFYSNRIRLFGNLRKFVLKKILFYAIIYISVRTMGTGDAKKPWNARKGEEIYIIRKHKFCILYD